MCEIFIYNKLSGKGISKKRLKDIVDYISSYYPKIKLCPTSKKGDAKTYTQKYLKSVTIIFVLGGDGTIHDIVSAIIGSNYSPNICVIPNGTMNDLAHTLNISKDYKKAIDLTVNGKAKKYTVLKINDKYTVYASALGRFTSTSYNTTQKNKKIYGRLSYFLGIFKELISYPPIHAKISIDGKIIVGHYALIIACIGKYIAGFNIGKNATYSGGKCILIKETPSKKRGSIKSTCNIIKFFLKGLNIANTSDNIEIMDFKTLNIYPDLEYPIVLDGEKYVSKTYKISVIPNAVKFYSNDSF